MRKTLLIIDLSHLFWSNWHATSDKPIGEAFERTVTRVHSLRSQYDFAACALDMPPYWRKELHEGYKANREAQPPQALEQFRRVKERLERDGVLLLGAKGFEADDIAATVAAWVVEKRVCSLVLASADKDWLQLVDDEADVRVLSTASGVMYQREQVIAKLAVAPDQVVDWLSLVGDSSDNIPGVPGVGAKTAAKLLMQYGSLEEVLANCDKQTPKLSEALFQHAGTARTARRLVALRTDAPIDFDAIFAERQEAPLPEDEQPQEDEEVTDEEVGEIISGPEPESEPFHPKEPPKSFPPPAPGPGPAKTSLIVAPQVHPETVEWNMRLQPSHIEGVFKLAGNLHQSRFYPKFPNANAIAAVIIRGREMGLGALTALDIMSFVEGKVSISAHLIVAKAKEHPDCKYFMFIGGDDTYAEWETQNAQNPKPTKLKYTIEQARRAGLVRSRSNWETRPAEMLRKTAAVQLARIEYPSAALGLYCPEEMGADAA